MEDALLLFILNVKATIAKGIKRRMITNAEMTASYIYGILKIKRLGPRVQYSLPLAKEQRSKYILARTYQM